MIVSDVFSEPFANKSKSNHVQRLGQMPRANKLETKPNFSTSSSLEPVFQNHGEPAEARKGFDDHGKQFQKNTKGEQKLSRVTMHMGKQACAKGIEPNNAQ